MELIHRNKYWAVQKKGKSEYLLEIIKEEIPELQENEVLIKNLLSSINYRDILSIGGDFSITRKFPYTPGVDFVGEVIHSKSKKFNKDDCVSILSAPNNYLNPGGWSKYIICKDSNLFLVPQKWNKLNLAAIGTAGFAAASGISSIHSFLNSKNGKNKKILISGASGGVGSIATILAAEKNWDITVLTRSVEKNKNFFVNLGANTILNTNDFSNIKKQNLLRQEFDAVIDTVGGEVLVNCVKSLKNNGILASAGLVHSQEINNLTVLPFLMRGVAIVGTGSEVINSHRKKAAMDLISSVVNSEKFEIVLNKISFGDLGKLTLEIFNDKTTFNGRMVIEISD